MSKDSFIGPSVSVSFSSPSYQAYIFIAKSCEIMEQTFVRQARFTFLPLFSTHPAFLLVLFSPHLFLGSGA